MNGPMHEPAKAIYAALVAEQEHRSERGVYEWILRERQAVHQAVEVAAMRHGLRPLSMAEVKIAEDMASGHCDYTMKYALGAAEMMRRQAEPAPGRGTNTTSLPDSKESNR
jgi:hypothetical protein